MPATKRARAGSPSSSSRSSVERNSTVAPVNALNGSDSGAEDEKDDRPTTFGEKLRAGKDDEDDAHSEDEHPKMVLTEQESTFLVQHILTDF